MPLESPFDSDLEWRRAAFTLHTLATNPSSVRYEIWKILGEAFQLAPSAGSICRLFERLRRNDLIMVRKFGLMRKVEFALVRLTPKGVDFCESIGIAVTPSDWEVADLRLAAEPADTRALILEMGYQARLRGFSFEVAPAGGPFCHAALFLNGRRIFINFCVSANVPGIYLEAWKAQGFAAVCGLSSSTNAVLKAVIMPHVSQGFTTDLYSLVNATRKSLFEFFWLTSWGWESGDIPLLNKEQA
ncbi:MAG TPA: hypothetical protein PKW33_11875 [Anaerolineaceae bacterium]|nr:hypothetical protein [Anaerolineaceae bacterium]HPN52278.1 hypothetical protein [Anaerolineaceae bacterium]